MTTIEYLTQLVKSLAVNPDEIDIEEYFSEGRIMFYIKCDKSDKGRIIGKEGKTIRAIQQITYAYMKKDSEASDTQKEIVRMSVEGI